MELYTFPTMHIYIPDLFVRFRFRSITNRTPYEILTHFPQNSDPSQSYLASAYRSLIIFDSSL